MTDEVPELPDWVKTLIEDSYDKGYQEGIRTGERYQWNRDKDALERNNPL